MMPLRWDLNPQPLPLATMSYYIKNSQKFLTEPPKHMHLNNEISLL